MRHRLGVSSRAPATRRRRISRIVIVDAVSPVRLPDNICKRPSAAQCSSCSASRPQPPLNGPLRSQSTASISYAALDRPGSDCGATLAQVRGPARRPRRPALRQSHGMARGLLRRCGDRGHRGSVQHLVDGKGARFPAERLRGAIAVRHSRASGSATSPRTLPPCAPASAHQGLEKVVLIGARPA